MYNILLKVIHNIAIFCTAENFDINYREALKIIGEVLSNTYKFPFFFYLYT